jgi:hypothetical protein
LVDLSADEGDQGASSGNDSKVDRNAFSSLSLGFLMNRSLPFVPPDFFLLRSFFDDG